jgi:hypothetical protein
MSSSSWIFWHTKQWLIVRWLIGLSVETQWEKKVSDPLHRIPQLEWDVGCGFQFWKRCILTAQKSQWVVFRERVYVICGLIVFINENSFTMYKIIFTNYLRKWVYKRKKK